jgi:hypothetical protein
MIAAIYARKGTDQHRGISARGNGAAVMVTAIGYVRRSKESGARTVSLEDQRARIADYAQGQGWQVAEVVADDGVSGGRRECLERLAERVRVTRRARDRRLSPRPLSPRSGGHEAPRGHSMR